MPDRPLQGMTIGVTAERRAAQQAELLIKRGAAVLHGPTLRVFSLDDDQVLRSRTADVIARPPDFARFDRLRHRTWLAAADSWGLRDALLEALRLARVANRGAQSSLGE